MDLKELIKLYFKSNQFDNVINHFVELVTDNSKEVVNNSIFVVIDGVEKKGIDYLDEAINNGAKTIISSSREIIQIKGINYLYVEDSKDWYNNYLIESNKNILEKVKIIGITGTNGKTTTTFIAYSILKKYYNVCLIGTNGTYLTINKKELFINSLNTTPKLSFIVNVLKRNPHINILILEVSSEALYYKRLGILKFDIIGLTNIGHDHVNTHLSYENYLLSKASLFKCFKENGLKKAIINVDDKNKGKFIKSLNKNIELFTYGINNGSLRGELLELNKSHMMIKVSDSFHEVIMGTNLIGVFNIYNILLAIKICQLLNIDFMKIIDFFNKDINIKGRYVHIRHKNRDVYIDYAHNPEAIKEYMKLISSVSDNLVVAVIGAGGDKDAKKRPKMAYFAKLYSDVLILTEDTSRNEDLDNILSDLTKELEDDEYIIIKNRIEAIKYAFEITKENDVIVLLGMGLDSYGEYNDQKVVESII